MNRIALLRVDLYLRFAGGLRFGAEHQRFGDQPLSTYALGYEPAVHQRDEPVFLRSVVASKYRSMSYHVPFTPFGPNAMS